MRLRLQATSHPAHKALAKSCRSIKYNDKARKVAKWPPFLLAKNILITDKRQSAIMQTLHSQLTELVSGTLEAMGLELVQLNILDGRKGKTLQLLVDNPSTGRITVDECASASRQISAILDVEDVIQHSFTLEVSSPGIDRPLVKHADYEKYLGFDAKIETRLPVGSRRRFKGPLIALGESTVDIRVDGEVFTLPLDQIASARLILNDTLIKAHQNGRLQGGADSAVTIQHDEQV